MFVGPCEGGGRQPLPPPAFLLYLPLLFHFPPASSSRTLSPRLPCLANSSVSFFSRGLWGFPCLGSADPEGEGPSGGGPRAGSLPWTRPLPF